MFFMFRNENSSVCAVSELPVQGANGKRLFVCNIPQAKIFICLQLRVFQGGRELYNRSLYPEHSGEFSVQVESLCSTEGDQVNFFSCSFTVLLDPPVNLTVVSTGKQGELNVSWLPPAVKYFDDSFMYEIRYVAKGVPMRKVHKNVHLFNVSSQEYILETFSQSKC